MEICSNTIDEKHEEIEDSLEDLQIFPTRKGLRRSFAMIKAYFVFEETIMRQIGFRDEDYQSMMEDQQHILNDAVKELNKGTQVAASSSTCESCWIQAPKGIDKGIGKNLASQLASAFTRHAECFKDMYIDVKK